MSYKVSTFLKLIHALLQPMLRWNDVFEKLPFSYDDLREVAKIDKTQQIGFFTFEPRVL